MRSRPDSNFDTSRTMADTPIHEVVLGKVGDVYASAATAVQASPIPTYYSAVFGEVPLKEFIIGWLPLILSVVMPTLCLLFVSVGLCKKGDSKPVGHRVVQRITIAIRADVRMIKGMSMKRMMSGPKDVESGKKVSPVKGKAEEAAIKKKAAEKGGKGGRFY